MIDQSQLVHDVLSLRSDFDVWGLPEDCTTLDYAWALVPSATDRVPETLATWEGPVAAWGGQTWVGLAA
jgi:hypothetical protein